DLVGEIGFELDQIALLLFEAGERRLQVGGGPLGLRAPRRRPSNSCRSRPATEDGAEQVAGSRDQLLLLSGFHIGGQLGYPPVGPGDLVFGGSSRRVGGEGASGESGNTVM